MPWRRGVSADLIFPEFEAIWENVFAFSNNVLENESGVTQSKFHNARLKPTKAQSRKSGIILESTST